MNNHAGTPVVIKADSLLTDKGIITDNFTLKVLNGRFQEIGKSAGYDNELAAMDLTGFTICPTFCDYHLHFSKKSIDDPESISTVLLQYGITRVWDGGDKDFSSLPCKKLFQGRIEVVTSSCALYRKGTYGNFLGTGVASADEAKAVIDQEVCNRGVDTVKVINSGVVDTQTGKITEGGFTKNELCKIIAYAREKGFPVTCHANGDRAVLDAIDAGASTIVHGFFITPKALARMIEKNVAFVPTSYAFYSLSKKTNAAHIRERIVTITEQHSGTVKMASDMGVKILAGSDSMPSFLPYGETFFEELRFLEAAGLGFEKTLMTAVNEPLKPGAQADFLVLDDLKIHSVFIRGQRLTTPSSWKTDF